MFGRYNPYAGHSNHICGIFFNLDAKRVYLPQVELKSHTTINPVCFTTQLQQTFQNVNDNTLAKVQYTFPLYDGVAVSGYTIRWADKELRGFVQQKDEAKQTYQAAVDRGETAGLLESLPAGIFGVTLGNVPANTAIVVELTYCGELKHDAAIDGLRYNLPTNIAPRYGSYPGELLTTNNAVARKGISITVDLDMASSSIRKVQSPSHPISVSMGATSKTEGAQSPFQPSQASATLALGTTELGGDFILQVLIDDLSKPQALLETHPTLPNQRAIMATLVPKFNLPSGNPEIVFIADQSGSMGGLKNTALVSALRVFIKSLPFGVRFNICAFGNSFKFLWPKSQAYSESNVKAALSFVDRFSADYGGTEILQPITAAFEQRLTDLPLEVMLLTDGEVWGERNVFAYVNEQINQKKVDARVFALGIGEDVSHTLVEGVARAGNGFAQFVTQNEETDQKVIRMLKGALFAHTKDYEMEVHYAEDSDQMKDDDEDFEIVEKVGACLKIDGSDSNSVVSEIETLKEKSPISFFDAATESDKATPSEQRSNRYSHLPKIETPKLLQAPTTIPPLAPFNRTTVYLLLGPDSTQKSIHSVTLRATSAQGPLELSIPVVKTNEAEREGSIHTLAARKAIQELEEGRGWITEALTSDGTLVKTKYESRLDEIAEREGVTLGEKFQIASRWTSFVAVQHQGEEVVEKVNQRYVSRVDAAVHSSPAAAAPRLFENVQQGGNLFGGFGNSPASAGGPFGRTSTLVPQSGDLFGTAPTTGGLFGSSPHGQSSTGGLFGGTATSNNSTKCFGSNGIQLDCTRQGGSGSLFGNTSNPSGGLFGNQQPPSGGLFGTNANASGGPFSGSPKKTKSPDGCLFSNYSTSTSGTGGGLFGGIQQGFTPKDLPTGRTLFGNNSSLTSSHAFEHTSIFRPEGSLFGDAQKKETEIFANVPDKHNDAAAVGTDQEAACRFDKISVLTSPASPSHISKWLQPSIEDESLVEYRAYQKPIFSAALQRGERLDSSKSSGLSKFRRMVGAKPAAAVSDGAPPPPPPGASQPLTSATYIPQAYSAGPSSLPPAPAPSGVPPPPARSMAPSRGGYGGGNVELSAGIVHARASPSFASKVASSVTQRFGGGAQAFSSRKKSASAAPDLQPQQQKSEDQDPLHALIALQTFFGAWALDDQLLRILEFSALNDDESVKIAGGEGSLEPGVIATALALAFLEKQYSEKKEVWEMVGEKARGWIGTRIGDVEGLMQRAREVLTQKTTTS